VNKAVPGEPPWAWTPSITYNAPLGVYMMASWGNGSTPQGGWFTKPSYLGLWLGPSPWGPFAQIHEDPAWTPADDQAARAHSPQIAPKWIAADGTSFWLAWSDYQYKDATGEENPDRGIIEVVKQQGTIETDDLARLTIELAHKHQPNYGFNIQRIDLSID
jgi:hypothetical protein